MCFDGPMFDNSLVSLLEHTYILYGSPYYKNSGEIFTCKILFFI